MLKLIQLEKIYKSKNIRNERDEELAELTASIEQNGLLNPLTVQQDGDRYQLIAGHRRYEALKRLGENYVECNVLEDTKTTQEIMDLQLVENTQRKQMSAYELVEIFDQYKSRGWTNKKIAAHFHKTEGWVQNNYTAIQILDREYGRDNIPEEKKKLGNGEIRAGYRRKVTGVTESITCQGMTVRHRGHEYMIHCANFEAEQALQQFINERRI